MRNCERIGSKLAAMAFAVFWIRVARPATARARFLRRGKDCHQTAPIGPSQALAGLPPLGSPLGSAEPLGTFDSRLIASAFSFGHSGRLSRNRDRGFESLFLQQRVIDEPWSPPRAAPPRADLASVGAPRLYYKGRHPGPT